MCSGGKLRCRLLKGGDVLVRVDGPYGEAEDTPDYLHYPVLALFAGGIGVRRCPLIQSRVQLPGLFFECGLNMCALLPLQVTPVLGIIQDLNRRRALLRKGQTMWPAQAHLVFAGRSTAELELLQSSIISDARCACLLRYQCSSHHPHHPFPK